MYTRRHGTGTLARTTTGRTRARRTLRRTAARRTQQADDLKLRRLVLPGSDAGVPAI